MKRFAAQQQRRIDDERAEKALRRRLLNRYAEGVDVSDKVYRPKASVGIRGAAKVKDTTPKVRYLNNVIVSRKGEKYITVEDAPPPPSTIVSGLKVITKGKRGKGFR